MQTEALAPSGTADAILQVLTWVLVALAAVWLITTVIRYFYRRAYNLTHAESGKSRDIKPDFLKVDKDKRQAALDRGAAYDARLAARETESAGKAATVEKAWYWSRIAATSAAILTLVATVLYTLDSVETIEKGLKQFSSWDRFAQLVSQHKVAAAVAIAVIGANIIATVKTIRKAAGKH